MPLCGARSVGIDLWECPQVCVSAAETWSVQARFPFPWLGPWARRLNSLHLNFLIWEMGSVFNTFLTALL